MVKLIKSEIVEKKVLFRKPFMRVDKPRAVRISVAFFHFADTRIFISSFPIVTIFRRLL